MRIRGRSRFILLTIVAINPVLSAFAQPVSGVNSIDLTRRYTDGDQTRYCLTTQVIHNSKWQSTIIAECRLTVVRDSSGIPYEEVRWLSKKVITAKDTTDHSADVNATQPYRISLHLNGKLELPKIEVPGMTGEITDFNTFFVAISPRVGLPALHAKGDTYKKDEPVKGDFANGKDILKGQDCLAITLTIKELTPAKALVQTDFMPPAQSCLTYFAPFMQHAVSGDTLNNFQMVRTFTNNKVNVFYGRENFVINSTIERAKGKLLHATMTNNLSLRLRLACNSDYNDCQTEMPFTIQRNLLLELLPE